MEPRCSKFSSMRKNDCSKEIGIVGWFASIGAKAVRASTSVDQGPPAADAALPPDPELKVLR